MSYKMVSEYGNVIYNVNTEREKEDLERRGFKCEPQADKPKTSEKRGAKNVKSEN